MAKITKINCSAFNVEMHGSLRWGKFGELHQIEHALVKVYTDSEVVGVAEAPIRPTIYGETLQSIKTIIELFSQKLVGLNVDDEQIYEIMTSIPNNHCAKGALDMALHDAMAKLSGKDVVEMYSGEKKQIRVSYILGISNLKTMLEEAKNVFSSGVRVFKIKIGRDSKHDEEIIQTLRQEFADEVILYVDANETLTPQAAPKRLEKLADLGIKYIEEPLPIHLVKERQHLKAQNILPIIGDDSCFTINDLDRELQLDTFDILNIKTARSGFRDSKIMLKKACEHQKGIMLGSQASCGLGTIFCAVMASNKEVSHPCELSFPLKLKNDILEKPIVYSDGFLDVSSLQTNLR